MMIMMIMMIMITKIVMLIATLILISEKEALAISAHPVNPPKTNLRIFKNLQAVFPKLSTLHIRPYFSLISHKVLIQQSIFRKCQKQNQTSMYSNTCWSNCSGLPE